MATLTYKEQYMHPNWQRKRLEVMEDAHFECENCGDSNTTLNVHHRRYVKGRMVWEYERNELACLCEPCHEEEHANKKALDLLLMQSGSLTFMVAFLAGFMEGSLSFDEHFDPKQFANPQGAFELGVLVSILDGQMPDGFLRAAEAACNLTSLTPTQESALARWRDFSDKLEKSGL